MTLHGPLKDFNFATNELFKSLNLLTIDDIYKLELAKFMYRATNNSLPKSFETYFIRAEHNYNLRSALSNPFQTRISNIIQYKRWLTSAGIKIWENLDPHLKIIPYQLFWRYYRKQLINNY